MGIKDRPLLSRWWECLESLRPERLTTLSVLVLVCGDVRGLCSSAGVLHSLDSVGVLHSLDDSIIVDE